MAPSAAPLTRRIALIQVLLMVLALALLAASYQLAVEPQVMRAGAAWVVPLHVLVLAVTALLVVALLLRRYRHSWASIGLQSIAPGQALGWGLVTIAGSYMLQGLVVSSYLVASGLSPEQVAAQKATWLQQFAMIPPALAVPVALTAGFYEEVVFRGLIQSRLLRVFDHARLQTRAATVLAVLTTALLFCAGHGYQGWLGVLQTLTVGLVFGAVTAWKKSLWPAIVAHAGIDIIGLVGAYLMQSSLRQMLEQTGP